MERSIWKIVKGQRAVDGAGVRLVRVLGYDDTEDFDPFLMLDSFDSIDPRDYTAGFPMHPHRGIETITYLISGRIEHQDSLGNRGAIGEGESQWMTAGSGILHEEMPKPALRMLGLQLWLNLPASEKMCPPAYLSIEPGMMPVVQQDGTQVRVLSGAYLGQTGVQPRHIQATIYDVSVSKGRTLRLDTKPEETVFIFIIDGDAVISGKRIPEKSAVLFGKGDFIEVSAPQDMDARFQFFMAPPLREPIAWGGPIVMNTEMELNQAFHQLQDGTFLDQLKA